SVGAREKARTYPRLTKLSTALQVFVERLLNDVARYVADDLLFHLSTLEDQQSRNAAHAVTLRSGDIFVHVHLADLDPAAVALCHFIPDGSQGPARTAPRRPEVNQHRLVRLQHCLVKIRVRYFQNCITCHVSS